MISFLHTVSLSGVFSSFWNHRSLIFQLTKREIIARYRGSFLGLLWSFITPLVMLVIYTFVFGLVFKVRLSQADVLSDNPYDFAMFLFSGLIVFNLFSECISRAPGLILANVNYVKKVIFPLEILPWVTLGAALFHAGISFFVLQLFLLLLGHTFSWNILWLPVILLPFLLLIMGLAWLLTSIGVFIRDIGQIVNMLLTALLFMSPIFYPLSALPELIRNYLFLNPLTHVVEQVRNIVLWNQVPHLVHLTLYSFAAIFVAWLGFYWFEKTKKGFADVL